MLNRNGACEESKKIFLIYLDCKFDVDFNSIDRLEDGIFFVFRTIFFNTHEDRSLGLYLKVIIFVYCLRILNLNKVLNNEY